LFEITVKDLLQLFQTKGRFSRRNIDL